MSKFYRYYPCVSQIVPLGHIQHQRPDVTRMVPNQVVPIWHIHRTSKARWCRDGTLYYVTYNVNNQVVLSLHIYMNFTGMSVRHFCLLLVTNLTPALCLVPGAEYCVISYLTSELCAESFPNALTIRVANITDYSVEVRNSENDSYFSRFLYRLSKFSDFLRILQFFDFLQHFLSSLGIITGFDHGVHHGLLIVIRNMWS